MGRDAERWSIFRDGQPVEMHPDTFKSEDAADEYARLVALAHPKSRVELRDRSGLVREYGPMGNKPDQS
jgi:hypothetical protein